MSGGRDSETTKTQALSPADAAEAQTVAWAKADESEVRVISPVALPRTLRSPDLPAGESGEARFEDQGELARGGMGSVHRVFDRTILRTVAVKRLHEAARALPGATARFLEEAQITGQLDHPNIVPVHDVEVDERGAPVAFSMKLVRGKTLKALTEEAHVEGPSGADLEAFARVLVKVCEAVSFAHSRGVIHRDLKPDNVMVGSHGQVYVMDWGIALLRACERPSELRVDAHGLDSGGGPPVIVGTPAYMAPEQANGRVDEIDERTDVFGIGAILYRLLTGRAPFAAKSSEEAMARARAGQVEPPDRVAPGLRLPPGLGRIAMKALAPDREDRHGSVDELRLALEDFLRGGGWFRTLELRAGTVIVREGDEPDAAYIINSGTCEAYKIVDGDKRVLGRLGPGDAFGETSIFAATPRTASVVALENVELTEITVETLERETARSTWMRPFLTALAERYLEADKKLAQR